MTEQIDDEIIDLKCPYCKHKLYYGDKVGWYFEWKTCPWCGKNFEVKRKVRYYIKIE